MSLFRSLVNQPISTSLFVDTVESSLNFTKRWATKKSAGTTKNGRDSNPKYLGLKKFGGELVKSGNIIIRQRGTQFHPGTGVGLGRDHTIYATTNGYVHFHTSTLNKYNQPSKERKFISVVDNEQMSSIRASQLALNPNNKSIINYKKLPESILNETTSSSQAQQQQL
ncbi:hypothetical protein SAMD00019534_121780 [Acytostelium subglobosum LB1]|uniref:hypothetical protein n=1 Tax=Acytostelium subglobosum LB1 TaxID=1410327 RepID=UPI0006448D3E|nr:hypothetical protein SAMD00019534_121780 [Acytostelium subglobosum LB1]GAM29002.1 hypothetical protein SAMD00019534_121780 [Acytostelium subglobosum LB1]|eukprot:XP_012748008.1 hypothetical protein SAMD00019534_121780 [Acytostelium subglobosum LB1]